MRGQLSCEHCGGTEVRRHPKEHWNDRDRWLCRPCIIARGIISQARDRMRRVQHWAKNCPQYLDASPLPSDAVVKHRLSTARSRAHRRGLPATLTVQAWNCITTFFESRCAYCGDPWEEIEHATAICRGGGTTFANCLPACTRCNGVKHQHSLEDLLAKDLWPHQTTRLEHALSWLHCHGRTSENPSGPKVPYGWMPPTLRAQPLRHATRVVLAIDGVLNTQPPDVQPSTGISELLAACGHQRFLGACMDEL